MDAVKTSSLPRILLVEDDEGDRLAFSQTLQKREASPALKGGGSALRQRFASGKRAGQISCEITECGRAEEALERLRADASSFDLAVIDHVLPGMSGLDLCKELVDEGASLTILD